MSPGPNKVRIELTIRDGLYQWLCHMAAMSGHGISTKIANDILERAMADYPITRSGGV